MSELKNTEARIGFIASVMKSHKTYWDSQRVIMSKLRNAYNTDFYKGQEHLVGANEVRIECATGYEFIESYIGSLYQQAPAVQIEADPVAAAGSPVLAETLVNRFLQGKREVIEQASRLALIYPFACLKLAPRESTDVLELVDIKAIEPWNIIVDFDADSVESSRFIGHRYWLNLVEAKKRFGSRRYTPSPKEDFFEVTQGSKDHAYDLPDEFLYVEVVELYDLVNDQLFFWTPNLPEDNGLLEKCPIPIRDHDNSPVPAIIPIYFARDPSRPMIGYSALARIYDQIREKNLMRTRMANGIRRDARQFLYNKEVLDAGALEQIARGEDGALIGIEGDLGGVISLVPNPTLNPDHQLYLSQIETDLNKGSLMAPFTRGEATQATATEVMALQTYTHSEIGRMARARDNSLEALANCYLRLLSTALDDKKLPSIYTSEGPMFISVDKLDAKFNIGSLDAGNSPVSKMFKQRQFVPLIGALTSLGADRTALMEELVKTFDLPRSLIPKTPPAPSEPQDGRVAPLTETALRKVLPE